MLYEKRFVFSGVSSSVLNERNEDLGKSSNT